MDYFNIFVYKHIILVTFQPLNIKFTGLQGFRLCGVDRAFRSPWTFGLYIFIYKHIILVTFQPKGKVYGFARVSTLRSRPGFPVALDLRIIYFVYKHIILVTFQTLKVKFTVLQGFDSAESTGLSGRPGPSDYIFCV